MKTITKHSLDELAKSMPIINETESSGIIGGTQYFDLSGNYLGNIGNSNEIKITHFDSGSFNPLKQYGEGALKNAFDSGCYTMDAVNTSIRGKIMKSVANRYGFKNVTTNSQRDGAAGEWDPYNPNYININPDAAIFKRPGCNMFDIICNLIHENNHRALERYENLDNYKKSTVKAFLEINAYDAVFKDSTNYNKASEEYKANAEYQFNKNLKIYNGPSFY